MRQRRPRQHPHHRRHRRGNRGRSSPPRAAIFYQDRSRQLSRSSTTAPTAIAHWAMAQGIEARRRRGAADGEPSRISDAAWLGTASRLGAVAALINTNLSGAALAHSIAIVGARHAIVGAELGTPSRGGALFDGRPLALGRGRRVLGSARSRQPPWRMLSARARRQERARRAHRQGPRPLHLHLRHHGPAQGRQFHPYAHAVHDVRLRRGAEHQSRATASTFPLPLYHATGGICAVGMALTAGGALILQAQILGA